MDFPGDKHATTRSKLEIEDYEAKDVKVEKEDKVSWDSISWPCYHCNQIFNDYNTLTNHQNSTHQIIEVEDTYYNCNQCGEPVFKYTGFLNHIRSVHSEALKLCCDVCNETFPDYEQLAFHRDRHIGELNNFHPSIYHCALCEMVRPTEKDLKNHIQQAHGLKIVSCEEEDVKRPPSTANLDDNRSLALNPCKEEFNETQPIFQCGECVQNFNNEAELEIHMLLHTRERPFKCKICPETFKNKTNLKTHMRSHAADPLIPSNNAETIYECKICKKSLNSKTELMNHESLHYTGELPFLSDVCKEIPTTNDHSKMHVLLHTRGRPFKCRICPETFRNKTNLKTHMRSHAADLLISSNNEEAIYECKICKKSLNSKHALMNHESLHYTGELPFLSDVCKEPTTNDLSKDFNDTHAKEHTFKCKICEKSFDSEAFLMDHLPRHTNKRSYKCEICSKIFHNRASFRIHVKTHKRERVFKCNDCEKHFASKFLLKRHLRTHNDYRPHKCEICSKTFKHEKSYVDHLQIHVGNPDFKCEICDKFLSNKQALANHKFLHTDERPFKCEVCEKGFIAKYLLMSHKILHTIERPFKCNGCEKSYTRRTLLKRHLRTHTYDRPFKCEKCLETFKHQQDYDYHMRTHGSNDFKCEICSKYFYYKRDLTYHRLSHTGECIFKCKRCLRACKTKRILRQHVLDEHEAKSDRRLKCEFCCMRFLDTLSFDKHVRTHTDDGPYLSEISPSTIKRKSNLKSHEEESCHEESSIAVDVED